jgi:hypothetical protein
MFKRIIALLFLIALVPAMSAIPTVGAASGITSNGFNATVTGVTGSEAWIMWGDYSGMENWASVHVTALGGSANVQVLGAPIYGGESVYYQGCDETGCGNELSTVISAVTPMPTTTHGQLLKNITNRRFDPQVISSSLLSAYTQVTPATIVFSIVFIFLMMGIWYRTKSVRLIAIVGMIISPFIMYSTVGLNLGVPMLGIQVAQALLAAAFAGILFSFMRK